MEKENFRCLTSFSEMHPGSGIEYILLSSDGQVRKRKGRSGLSRCDFTEGWVEFRDKRVAKRVAASLHNTPMGTRKRQRFFHDLWSIKVQSTFTFLLLQMSCKTKLVKAAEPHWTTLDHTGPHWTGFCVTWLPCLSLYLSVFVVPAQVPVDSPK